MPVRDRQTSADATAPESFTLIAVREVRRDRVYCTASWIITILLRIALLCSFGLLAARTFFHAIDFGNAALIETVVHVMQTVVGIIGFRLLPGLRSDIDALQ